MFTKKTFSQFWGPETSRNLGLSALMALMWIGSFYLYGAGAIKLGRLGVVVGWPLFISLSIVVGNIWGLWRGEWRGAASSARHLLNLGLLVLIVAVIVVALSNSF
jgi:L-rhamnose-H+ transport protein